MNVAAASEPYYPTFTFRYDEDADLPEEGEMVIKYRLSRKEQDTKAPKDEQFACTIEVTKIISVESEEEEAGENENNDAEEGEEMSAPAKSYGKDAADALDKLVEEMRKLKKSNEKMVEKDEETHAMM